VWLLAIVFVADTTPTARMFRVPLPRAESLSVETAGRGEPVVLIPGLFGSAYGFRTLVPLLTAAGYRTIVIEPLGIGSSARPEKANYSLTAQTDRIAAVLDSLHVRDALLIAHSIGGSEAFRLAYRRPDLVRGLVSIEGGPTETATTPAFKRALRFAPWIKLFGGIKLLRRKIRGLLIDSSGDSSRATRRAPRGTWTPRSRRMSRWRTRGSPSGSRPTSPRCRVPCGWWLAGHATTVTSGRGRCSCSSACCGRSHSTPSRGRGTSSMKSSPGR